MAKTRHASTSNKKSSPLRRGIRRSSAATKSHPAKSTSAGVTKRKAKPSTRSHASNSHSSDHAESSRLQSMAEAVSHAAAKLAAEAKAMVTRMGARRAKRQASVLHFVGAESWAKSADKRAVRRQRAATSATRTASRV